jgi:hypothetical protein
MKNIDLTRDACVAVSKEYSQKSYGDLLKLRGNPDCFLREIEGRVYLFEVDSKSIDDTLVSVCVLCKSRHLLAISKAVYFGKRPSGEVIFNDDSLPF